MTILTPTSNPSPVGGGASTSPPPGLPDESLLAKLASEFFAALPGSGLPVGAGFGHLPSSPSLPSAPSPAGLGPQSADAAGPALLPGSPAVEPVGHAAPPADGRNRGIAAGVPEAYAAALPELGLPSAPSAPGGSAPGPSSPYYFLGESSAYQSAPTGGRFSEDRVTAKPGGLPGNDDLSSVLAGLDLAPAREPGAASNSGSQFYFLDSLYGVKDASRRDGALPTGAHPAFDVQAVRRDFPILSERVNGKPLIWLDNAATTQKPQAVIDRLAYFYAHENSNIHRAAHELAARATDAYEGARNKVARFIGAGSAEEIIFVRGATEAINLVAKSWGAQNIGAGDEIVVSLLEHHANIVPWQQLAAEKGANIRVIPVDDSGQIILEEYRKLLNDRTKLVSVTQVSNALGTVTPIKEIIEQAHAAGAKVLVDGAQSVSHLRVNVKALDADFFVFSGHKVFAPTGIGVVYGKKAILDATQPWQGGGNMIADVTFERTVYQPAPAKFEAGTGNIADAVGLGAALDYLEKLGLENVARYEHDLLAYATHRLRQVAGVHLVGTAREKTSVLSFVLDGYKTEEVGKALNEEGIAVRSGHHCAQPILRRFGYEATVRPSLAFYNTCEEIDTLVAVVRRLSQARSGRR